MSMDNLTDDDAPTHKGKRPRIILIYALAGPPIGGIVAILSIYMYTAITSGFEIWLDNVRAEPIQTLLSLLMTLVAVAFYGYILGGIQALLTGSFISLFAGKDGKFGYGLAIIAPAFVALGVGGAWMVFYQIRVGFTPFFEPPIMLGAIGVAASVTVRFLFRKQFSPKFSKT
jgi:hypothetical protein